MILRILVIVGFCAVCLGKCDDDLLGGVAGVAGSDRRIKTFYNVSA